MSKNRETSRLSYALLVKSGKLKGNQARIIERLIESGPATSGEVLGAMGIHNVNAWRARFTELNARGMLREVTVRPCKVSGRQAIVWEFSGRDKPLETSKGAKAKGTAKQWKEIASGAIAVLHAAGVTAPEVGSLVTKAKALGL